MIRTQAEMDHLRSGERATERAIHVAYELACAGDTEKSVADIIGFAITKLGADRVGFSVVASGGRTALGHHYAEQVPPKPGDLSRADYGWLFSSQWTDMVRMAFVGESLDRQRAGYHKIIQIHREMLEGMRPGAIPH
jgi:Xaa-Pro aminopeptidase